MKQTERYVRLQLQLILICAIILNDLFQVFRLHLKLRGKYVYIKQSNKFQEKVSYSFISSAEQTNNLKAMVIQRTVNYT